MPASLFVLMGFWNCLERRIIVAISSWSVHTYRLRQDINPQHQSKNAPARAWRFLRDAHPPAVEQRRLEARKSSLNRFEFSLLRVHGPEYLTPLPKTASAAAPPARLTPHATPARKPNSTPQASCISPFLEWVSSVFLDSPKTCCCRTACAWTNVVVWPVGPLRQQIKAGNRLVQKVHGHKSGQSRRAMEGRPGENYLSPKARYGRRRAATCILQLQITTPKVPHAYPAVSLAPPKVPRMHCARITYVTATGGLDKPWVRDNTGQ